MACNGAKVGHPAPHVPVGAPREVQQRSYCIHHVAAEDSLPLPLAFLCILQPKQQANIYSTAPEDADEPPFRAPAAALHAEAHLCISSGLSAHLGGHDRGFGRQAVLLQHGQDGAAAEDSRGDALSARGNCPRIGAAQLLDLLCKLSPHARAHASPKCDLHPRTGILSPACTSAHRDCCCIRSKAAQAIALSTVLA